MVGVISPLHSLAFAHGLVIFEGIFDFYSHHLLDPENQFQTIMCIPSRSLDLDALKWKGWEVIRTTGRPPSVSVSQELRIL